MAEMQAITDADFDTSVLKSDKPVLVDFWAEWCGPCRQVDPILKEIAAEHGEKLTFVKMNVDENPVTPAAYRVTGIPTLNVFQNGELVKQIVGAKPKAALLSELQRLHRLTSSTPTPRPRRERPRPPTGRGAGRRTRPIAGQTGPRAGHRPWRNGQTSVWVDGPRSRCAPPRPTASPERSRHVRGHHRVRRTRADRATRLFRLGDRGRAVAEIRDRLALLGLTAASGAGRHTDPDDVRRAAGPGGPGLPAAARAERRRHRRARAPTGCSRRPAGGSATGC